MTGQRYAGKIVSALQFYLLLLILFTGYRLLLIAVSITPLTHLSDLLITGLRFDSRWVSLFTFPLVVLYLLQSLFRFPKLQIIEKVYVRSVLFFLLLLFVLDYYYYQYTATRLSPYVLELVKPFSVAAKMIWQTYPVVPLLFVLVVVIWLIDRLILKRLFTASYEKRLSVKESGIAIVVLLLLLLNAWGSLKKYPLTWSQAFHTPEAGVLVLNPAESFFYGVFYYEEAAPPPSAKDYTLLRHTLQYDSARMQQMRAVKNKFAQGNTGMNVVVIFAESLSSYKTSLQPNQLLNPTPFIKTLADSSYYFTHCFTPHYGTARAVWNLFTGMPDVNWNKLATHKIPSVAIPVVLNQMEFRKKYYLLGGDGTWADIKGFLNANVEGLQVMDQLQMKARPVSVWGVDDYDLLMQANELFARTDSPFFAVVQTASNHKPYVIPSEAKQRGFELKEQQTGTLQKFGFISNAEYNAVRYLDFCLASFFTKAAASAYFRNTLFVIVGDHGTVGNVSAVMHPDWNTYKLKMLHVPLLFYKQGAAVARDTVLCSIQDILPTIQGIVNNKHQADITGVDLFSGYYKAGQFFILQDLHQLGWITPSARFIGSYKNGNLENRISNQSASQADTLSSLVLAAYRIYAAQHRSAKK